MGLFRQVKTLVYKDMLLEWRSRYVLNGMLLYVVSTVFVCYQAFQSVDTPVWNALFWIVLLFAAINATGRSFVQESPYRRLYYYSIASPQAVVLAKMVYNMLVMVLLSGIAFAVYSLVFPIPMGDPLLYLAAVLLGSMSFASVFTMVSGISSKTGNSGTIMAVLGFPVIVPLLIVLLRLSQNALNGLERAASSGEVFVLLAINAIAVAVSLLLFPYLWRD